MLRGYHVVTYVPATTLMKISPNLDFGYSCGFLMQTLLSTMSVQYYLDIYGLIAGQFRHKKHTHRIGAYLQIGPKAHITFTKNMVPIACMPMKAI